MFFLRKIEQSCLNWLTRVRHRNWPNYEAQLFSVFYHYRIVEKTYAPPAVLFSVPN
jgi:hypothetical protein